MSTPAELLKQAQEARDAAAAALAKADAAVAAIKTGAAGAVSATAAAVGVDPIVFQFAIFVMAIFVGYYVVWSVTPALHTPLMSVTNAISSVIVVGALLAVSVGTLADTGFAREFGFVALILASVNIFGGFLVTQRMLAMYKKKD
jgi:NAD(P) transhydrogenase subunit alpha